MSTAEQDVEVAATVSSEPPDRTLPASSTRARFATTLPPIGGRMSEGGTAAAATMRFEHLRSLGKGAMGEVELARDHDIDRMVAIKRLLLPEAMERFAEEVRTIGQLEHPNIPPVHDVGFDERGHFFVMKYVKGETLASVIAKLAAGDAACLRGYSIERRVEIVIGVLRALQSAHARGIVHRDVKPANVMVGEHGEVMLMDWGIAKSARASAAAAAARSRPGASLAVASSSSSGPGSTTDGELIGTPWYMAPEQARGDNRSVDARSDLYAASVLLHELLCLKHYLADRTNLSALLAWIAGPEELSALELGDRRHPGAPRPPAELLYVVARGLRKDPARRFQAVDEMIAELAQFSEGRYAVRCQATASKRLLRGLGRMVDHHPVFGPSALLLGLLLAGLGLVRLLALLLRHL